jgi:hypothetical protein
MGTDAENRCYVVAAKVSKSECAIDAYEVVDVHEDVRGCGTFTCLPRMTFGTMRPWFFHQRSTEPAEPRLRGCMKPQTPKFGSIYSTVETAVAPQYPARTRFFTHMGRNVFDIN